MRYRRNTEWRLIVLGLDSILVHRPSNATWYLHSFEEEIYFNLERLNISEIVKIISNRYDFKITDIESVVEKVISKFLKEEVIQSIN